MSNCVSVVCFILEWNGPILIWFQYEQRQCSHSICCHYYPLVSCHLLPSANSRHKSLLRCLLFLCFNCSGTCILTIFGILYNALPTVGSTCIDHDKNSMESCTHCCHSKINQEKALHPVWSWPRTIVSVKEFAVDCLPEPQEVAQGVMRFCSVDFVVLMLAHQTVPWVLKGSVSMLFFLATFVEKI